MHSIPQARQWCPELAQKRRDLVETWWSGFRQRRRIAVRRVTSYRRAVDETVLPLVHRYRYVCSSQAVPMVPLPQGEYPPGHPELQRLDLIRIWMLTCRGGGDEIVFAKADRGIWGLGHVINDKLYLTRDLVESRPRCHKPCPSPPRQQSVQQSPRQSM